MGKAGNAIFSKNRYRGKLGRSLKASARVLSDKRKCARGAANLTVQKAITVNIGARARDSKIENPAGPLIARIYK